MLIVLGSSTLCVEHFSLLEHDGDFSQKTGEVELD